MTEAAVVNSPPPRISKDFHKVLISPLRVFNPLRNAFFFAIKEPFFHFIVLGALLFAFNEYLEARANHARIDISKGQIKSIADNYQLQYGSIPNETQLQSLVDSFIREEVFYHEALRLHLDQDDEIIRRRLVQKYEFLQQDLGIAKDPSENYLRAFYFDHQAKYLIPEKVSFSHVFYSTDLRGEQGAQLAAQNALIEFNKQGIQRTSDEGDRFSGASDYVGLGEVEVSRLFGNKGLVEKLFNQPLNQWVGPFRSGYGWHVVYVNEKNAPTAAPYTEIKEAVLRDYLEYQRGLRNQESLVKLKKSFTIVVGQS
jgi:parvulin-like peptidyl-prolyl isomerase